jgi:hypothetical protein
VKPPDGSTGILTATNVDITFNQTPSGVVDESSFLLHVALGPNQDRCATLGAQAPGTVTGGGTAWTLDPTNNLATKTWYCVTVTTATGLAQNFNSTFKTGNS